MKPKKTRFDVNGVVLVDKPLGYSSNQTLALVKKYFNPKKAGHTGTLDPLATGLLPVCLGEATKFSSFLLESDKSYDASIKLGFISTTGDSEGEIESTKIKNFPTLEEVQKVINSFLGYQEQLPPMFSALKFKGKPLYEYARKGENIDRKKRKINITSLKIKEYKDNIIHINVSCSKGTYIRVLANDIGASLKTGGYLVGLRRLAIGKITIKEAVNINLIEEMNAQSRKDLIHPIDTLIREFGKIILEEKDVKAIKDGRTLLLKNYGEGIYRLYANEDIFLGLGSLDLYGYLKAKRLRATN
ncbi:tRNA pseudouridine(55) synthase TruB [Methylophilaceae bacterium]|nr:tRNA pseudouridine(55) synthase TruB [Methylophilaceae bacterium]